MTFKSFVLGVFKRIGFFIPDKLYLQLIFILSMGYKLDLNNPKTLNEKLQWLKLYNRNTFYTNLVDKIKVKEVVGTIIGSEYIIPTIAVWDSPEDITFENLPESFVIKTNHSGGNTGVYVVKQKKSSSLQHIREIMSSSLKDDIYRSYREWPYKNVEKKIFAEECIGNNPIDFKFFCFNGIVDCVMLCMDRNTKDTKFYFFNPEWKLLRYNIRGKNAPNGFTLPKPDGIDKMFELAGKLSKGLPFARIDFYNENGRIYFGEITFFPASGLDSNLLPETDLYFGNMIDLTLARLEDKV